MKRICIYALLLAALSSGQLFSQIKDKLGLGLNINANKLFGDTRTGGLGINGGNLLLRYRWKPTLFIESELGYLSLSAKTGAAAFDTDMINFGGKVAYILSRSQLFQPFTYVGVGVLNFSDGGQSRFWDGYLAFGAGSEFFASDFLAVNLTADFRYTSGDGFDGGVDGWRRDGYFNMGLGLIYHFDRQRSGRPFLTEDISQPEFLYTEVDETNANEETNDIVESTDQDLNLKTLQSLLQEEKETRVVDSSVSWRDEIEPEPDRTVQTVIYTVQRDDWLSKIAQTFYGDSMAYAAIVKANLDIIQNPHVIYPGQKLRITIERGLRIPYAVKQGDSLSKIAIKFYGDPMKSNKIFMINQDLIENPDLIYVGQILEISFSEK